MHDIVSFTLQSFTSVLLFFLLPLRSSFLMSDTRNPRIPRSSGARWTSFAEKYWKNGICNLTEVICTTGNPIPSRTGALPVSPWTMYLPPPQDWHLHDHRRHKLLETCLVNARCEGGETSPPTDRNLSHSIRRLLRTKGYRTHTWQRCYRSTFRMCPWLSTLTRRPNRHLDCLSRQRNGWGLLFCL